MLIKKQLLTIKPKAPMAKYRETGNRFYVYASITEFSKDEPILAVFVYNIITHELLYRFFCDGTNFISYSDNEWHQKGIVDVVGWNTHMYVQYYKKSAKIIKDFLNEYNEGLCAIRSWICDYNYERRLRAATNRQKRIDDKINSVPDIRENLKPYCNEKLFPSYLFMTKKNKKGKRNVVCSHCGGKYQVSGVKHRESGVCKKCGRESTYYLRTYKGPTDKCKLLVCNKTKDGQYTAYQWLKVEREYIKDLKPTYYFDDYFYCFENGKSLEFYKWNYQYHHYGKSNYWYTYDKTYVYTPNLKDVFEKKFENIPVSIFEELKRPIYFFDLLLNLNEYPAAEYLVKLKLFSLAANQIVCNLDREKNFAKYLEVSGQYLPIFQKFDVNFNEVNFIKNCSCFLTEDYVKKLQAVLKNVDYKELLEFIKTAGMTAKKAITYLYNQMQRTKSTGKRCIGWYRDYAGMSKQMNVELSSKGLKYPPNIKKAHDQILDRVTIKDNRLEAHKFKVACRELYKTFISWHDDKYIIVRPQCRADFIREGQILSHCVGKHSCYYENHKKGTAIILFIRSVENTDKPLYTLELDCKELNIKQLYGKNDVKAPAEVHAFVKKYAKVIKKIINKKENAA